MNLVLVLTLFYNGFGEPVWGRRMVPEDKAPKSLGWECEMIGPVHVYATLVCMKRVGIR